MKHGLGGYTNKRCRCGICRTAATEKNIAYRNRERDGSKCLFPNCAQDKPVYSRGLCFNHSVTVSKMVKQGVRTREELVLGGYLLPAKPKTK